MKKYFKITIYVVLIIFSLWLVLPRINIIKPSETLFGLNIILLDNVLSLIKGIIPIVLFGLGSLLLYIEIDELFSNDIDLSNDDEGEMPAFEDVEYKDLECPECGEHFKTDIGLKVHRKVNHPEEFEEDI